MVSYKFFCHSLKLSKTMNKNWTRIFFITWRDDGSWIRREWAWTWHPCPSCSSQDASWWTQPSWWGSTCPRVGRVRGPWTWGFSESCYQWWNAPKDILMVILLRWPYEVDANNKRYHYDERKENYWDYLIRQERFLKYTRPIPIFLLSLLKISVSNRVKLAEPGFTEYSTFRKILTHMKYSAEHI